MQKTLSGSCLRRLRLISGSNRIDPDTDLIEQRIIDSLAILKLVTFLEESCGIKVLDEEIVPENFQSVNTLVRFVEEKRRGS